MHKRSDQTSSVLCYSVTRNWKGSILHLLGPNVPITSDDNAKFNLENERSYNSLSTAAFFMNMEIQT